ARRVGAGFEFGSVERWNPGTDGALHRFSLRTGGNWGQTEYYTDFLPNHGRDHATICSACHEDCPRTIIMSRLSLLSPSPAQEFSPLGCSPRAANSRTFLSCGDIGLGGRWTLTRRTCQGRP